MWVRHCRFDNPPQVFVNNINFLLLSFVTVGDFRRMTCEVGGCRKSQSEGSNFFRAYIFGSFGTTLGLSSRDPSVKTKNNLWVEWMDIAPSNSIQLIFTKVLKAGKKPALQYFPPFSFHRNLCHENEVKVNMLWRHLLRPCSSSQQNLTLLKNHLRRLKCLPHFLFIDLIIISYHADCTL